MSDVKPTQFLVTPADMIAKLEFAKTCLDNPMVMETAIDWSIQIITAMQAELAAEKALADQLGEIMDKPNQSRAGMYHYRWLRVDEAVTAYRKARGL